MSVNKQEIEKNRSGIIQFLGGLEIFEKYENSKDSEEKIDIVYNSSVMQALFKKQKEMFKSSNEPLKNDKESKLRWRVTNAGRTHRLEGWNSYVDCRFCYFYFQTNGKDSAYALALANRSAVQMRLGKEGVIHALADIGKPFI